MELEQLSVFISVVENGGFTRAAETLYISHSTTSRNVSALEESLGVQLLHREGRTVRLTEAGRLLYREGKALLEQVAVLETAVRDAGDTGRPTLTAASVSLFSDSLNAVYADFCAKHPEVILGVHHHELSEVAALVDRGEADIGVSFSYALPQDMDSLASQKAAEEHFCLVCAEGHPLTAHKSVRAEELSAFSYISVGEQRSDYAKRLEEALLRGRGLGGVITVPTLESLFLQVRSGNGVALVPCPMVRELGRGCASLELADVDTRFELVVFWRKDNLNPARRLFTELLAGS